MGATNHFVAVPQDRAEQPVREFAAFTAGIAWRSGWPSEVETVMESTGVYWIPLFGVLEERGFEVMLVDPRRIKNVPGRKTDVLDCQWLQAHLWPLSGAFRPDGDIRRLRSYAAAGHAGGVRVSSHPAYAEGVDPDEKLQHVISNITGQTGMAIIEAIVNGERDPQQLAKLRDHRIRADEATIARSLQGHWLEEHIFELTQALELYRFYHQKIAECDWEIEAQLERFEDVSDGGSPDGNGRRRSRRTQLRYQDPPDRKPDPDATASRH